MAPSGRIVSRIFLSHSSTDNAQAVALRDWLVSNGWKEEIFLDLDPQRGWRALGARSTRRQTAARRCCSWFPRRGSAPAGVAENSNSAPPEQAAINGDAGLVAALEEAFRSAEC